MASGYVECFSDIWETAAREWRLRGPTKNFFQEFLTQLFEYGDISVEDVQVTLLLGVLFTILRYVATAVLFKPFAEYFNFIPKDKKKFPESAWKLLYYGSAYSFTCYVLFSGKHQFFQDTVLCWKGWRKSMPVPSDIYTIYVVQAGFYFHSIYATVFMDKWRADSIVMICHHILANALILFSFATRYHNIGVIVLFLHDISDIFLEATKIFLCFNSRPNGPFRMFGFLVNAGFLSFALSWFICRLYLYPHKVLHTTGHSGRRLYEDLPFYFFFNSMLWALFAMNIWWFHFILLLIVRVLNGSSRAVEDTRELSTDSVESIEEEVKEMTLSTKELLNGSANGSVNNAQIRQIDQKSPTLSMNGGIKYDKLQDADEKDGQQEREYLHCRKHNTCGN